MNVTMSKELFDKMCSVILELPAKSVLNLVNEIQSSVKIIDESKQKDSEINKTE